MENIRYEYDWENHDKKEKFSEIYQTENFTVSLKTEYKDDHLEVVLHNNETGKYHQIWGAESIPFAVTIKGNIIFVTFRKPLGPMEDSEFEPDLYENEYLSSDHIIECTNMKELSFHCSFYHK